jgi:putative flippase GtrA
LKEYPIPFTPENCEPYYPIINDANLLTYEKYRGELKQFPHLLLCGRLAEYKYYNIDTVIERALDAADNLLPAYSSYNLHRSSYKSLFKEVFLYGLIGSFSAGIDSCLFLLLRTININLFLSNFLGINAGICCSFFLNTFINFRVRDNLPGRAFKFWIIGYCGLLLSMVIMFLGVTILQKQDIYVKIISVIVVAGLQFIFNKFFTFKLPGRNRNNG